MTKTIALDQVSELDDVPDILSMGRQFYVAEKVTANVSTASDKQITVTLDANFREVDQTTGQFKTSIPVSGTVTLKVSKE